MTLDVHLFELIKQTLLSLRLAEHDPPALGTTDSLATALSHLKRMLLSKTMIPLLSRKKSERTAFKEVCIHTHAQREHRAERAARARSASLSPGCTPFPPLP